MPYDHFVRSLVRDGEVEVTITVEIRRRDAGWRTTRPEVTAGNQSTRAVAEPHRDTTVLRRNGHIRATILVEVADHDAIGTRAHGELEMEVVAAVAVAEQDGHPIVTFAGHDEVGVAIRVEVSHRDGRGRGVG